MKNQLFFFSLMLLLFACQNQSSTGEETPEKQNDASSKIAPAAVTEKVRFDSDDPAIWVNPIDPAQSLVLGTDKETDGALYVFDLNGKIVEEKVVRNLKRPNNVDLEYGFDFLGKKMAVAVVTEREAEAIRVVSVPDMQLIDGGGIQVFEGEPDTLSRWPMGVALYKKPGTDSVYAIVGRKSGPTDSTYLWQYLLEAGPDSVVAGRLVRKFGAFTGKAEIEAIAVDDELGYVYYCEEGVGVRKYYADPAMGNTELALFGQNDFKEDAEGIAILSRPDSTGLLFISDQQEFAFNVYSRTGSQDNPHRHELLRKVYLSTRETDGCEVTGATLGAAFPGGLFVAMSDDSTYHYYPLDSLLQE